MRTLKLTIILAAASLAFCAERKADVFAQGGLYAETGQGGVRAGLVGGGAGYAISPRWTAFGEFNYIPVSMHVPSGYFEVSGYGMQAGGGVRGYMNPAGKSVRAFLSGAGGFMRATASGVTSAWWDPPRSVSASASGGYVGVGLGAEIGPKRFGVRPEFRFLRELVSGAKDGNAPVVMCGVYYRF